MRNDTWMRNVSLRCLFGTAVLLGASVAQGGPYDGWAYHAPVTFNGYGRSETLTNFPALVVLTNACFGGGYAFSYDQLQSGTNDLAFTDADGNSLNYEIDTWNPSGTSTVWVQVPVLTNNATVTAWWGAAGQSALACATNRSVWANGYAGVWHLSGNNNDSTSNRNNCTTSGTVTTNTGVVGNNRGVSILPSYLEATNSAPLRPATLTMEAWVNTTDTSASAGRIVDKGYVDYGMNVSGGKLFIELFSDWNGMSNPANIADGQWHHVSGTWNGTTVFAYVDGKPSAAYSKSGSWSQTWPLCMGCRADGHSGRQYNGQIDEVRISSLARSSNWVWAVYQNTASNAVFQSYGSVVSSSMSPAIQNVAATNVTQTSAFPNGLLTADGSSAASVTLYWGPTDGETNAAAWSNAVPFGANARPTPADYTTNLTGLASGATYYYRYYAANDSRSVWASSSLSFTTLALPVVGNGSGATNVFSSGAVLTGAVAVGTPAPSVYVCWGTADGGETTTGAWQNVVALGMQSGAFSTAISGLLPGTAYTYRCYAVNSQGEAWASPSATFTTASWTLSGSMLTDGNWSLTVNAAGGNYTITGFSAGSGDLDLRHTGFTITKIGGSAFYQNQQLTTLELPDTVTAIDERAFQQTLNLTRVVLSSSLQSIGQFAFAWDSGLTTVTPFLPDSVTQIGWSAFGACTSLSSPLRICNPAQSPTLSQYAFDYSAIPSADLSSVTDIGGYDFEENHSLTNVVFSSALKTIGERAFCKNTGLTHLTLPVSLQTIGAYAFAWDSGLTTVTPFLPDSVTQIGRSAFGACTSLSSPLRICNPAQSPTLSQYAFDYSAIPSVDLSSVTNIGDHAFEENRSLTNVVFSSALKTIGMSAFRNCMSLMNVAPLLPEALTSLGGSAFYNCPIAGDLVVGNAGPVTLLPDSQFYGAKIASATLGVGVTNLPAAMFGNCTGLQRVYFCGCPALGSGVFQSTTNYQMRTYIPKGHAEWQPITANQVTALTADEVTAFQAAYVGEKLPLGTWLPSGAGTVWYCTWVAPQDQHKGAVIYLK